VIRVHRIPFSTNVERVALAAGHKGLDIQWVDHEAADRSAIVALSGQELVPVAEFDGEVVRGSMRIVERIERDHPEPPLLPSDRAGAARARIFVAFFDRVWKGPPNALNGSTPPDAAALAARLETWSSWFEDLLTESPYLGGASLGLADIAAFPFLKYATIDPDPTDPDTFHQVLTRHLSATPTSHLAEWITRVDAHPRA
jgi:glutathione S-transferase